MSWTNYWSPNPPPRRSAGVPQARTSGEHTPGRIPIAGFVTADQDDDPAFRRRTPRRDEPNHAWRWWVAAAAAVVVATVSVEEWWLHQPETSALAAATVSVPAEPAVSAEPVRQAIEAYRQRASLFANRQMTCADLAPGLAAVDDEWLRYIKAAPPTPDRTRAKQVEGVEDDFEGTGCPRP